MVRWQGSMEGMGMSENFWKGRIVFLTGHTGFKGGWTALWLTHLGAKVYGFSLEPPSSPSFFEKTELESQVFRSVIGDICDLNTLSHELKNSGASVVIHMAAQSLVRESYSDPVKTYQTNLMGTLNLFEAVRNADSVKAVVNITTDKCYENQEWPWAYRESDRLGGYDPYSNSKACVELLTDCYRNSFFKEKNIHLASVRAGNVVGGGDWAQDRLIPDFFRALDQGKTLSIRSPQAIRPWQHVLEPISGYLKVAELLVCEGPRFAAAWNFGPEETDAKPVSWIVDKLCSQIAGARWEIDAQSVLHEAGRLKLDSSKAKEFLGWAPNWTLDQALQATISWHLAWKGRENMRDFSLDQIKAYSGE